jgi:hypothetical protein
MTDCKGSREIFVFYFWKVCPSINLVVISFAHDQVRVHGDHNYGHLCCHFQVLVSHSFKKLILFYLRVRNATTWIIIKLMNPSKDDKGQTKPKKNNNL